MMQAKEVVNGRCNRCGDCCRYIWLPVPLDEKRDNFGFVHWHKIAMPAKDPNPHRKAYKQRFKVVQSGKEYGYSDAFPEASFYECDQLDKKTNLCTAYNDRPRVCKIYPEETLRNYDFSSSRCGYIK